MRHYLLVLVAASVALAGCGIARDQAADIAIASTQAAAIKQQWSEVERIWDANRESLPAEEREQAAQAVETLSSVVAAIDVDDPRALLDNIDRARALYQRAASAYRTLRPIAAAAIQRGDVGTADALQLQRLDERIQSLDERIQDVESSTDADTVRMLGVIRDVVPALGRLVLILV